MIEKSKAIKNGVKVLDNSEKNEFFENLKSNFPQTIKDGKADLKAISLLLGIDKKADISGYELTWTGKGLSNAMYSFPCNKELRLDEIYSNVIANNEIMQGSSKRDAEAKNPYYHNSGDAKNDNNVASAHCVNSSKESTQGVKTPCYQGSGNDKNIIIRGDNLDALKILKSAYSEKIKMIYIDPPYNTANDNFIYPDNFREDYKAILREVGLIEIDENGEETESENLRFFKNIQSSRTHSGWLSFMLPRLKLARDLLKEDGVIFISIDDNEQANLKILCDEIFGEDNFVCNIIWQRTKTPARLSKNISKTHEFILVYAKDNNQFSMNKMPLNDEYVKKTYKNPDNDPRGKWRTAPLLGTESSSNKRATYTLPDGRQITGKWRCSEETLKRYIKENRLVYCENGAPNKKVFLSENEGQTINSILLESGTNDNATEELKSLFGIAIFDFPKPINLIKHFLQISTSTNKNEKTNGIIKEEFPKALKVAEPTVIANDNEAIHKKIDCHASARNDNTEADIILDFFAGSGTTAQAVMELNEEDGGNRQFILVQIDEEIKEEKSKSAYDFCKNELKSDKPVISDITIERVKRASKKIIKSNGAGFKVFTLSDKPEIITNEEKSLELISQRTLNDMDIIINMALTNGKTLDKKIETIFDGKLYKCEDAFYLIECDKEILQFLSETQNEYILIDAYGDIELEDFLNLGAGFKERLRVVY